MAGFQPSSSAVDPAIFLYYCENVHEVSTAEGLDGSRLDQVNFK